jgi:hypothetical protein
MLRRAKRERRRGGDPRGVGGGREGEEEGVSPESKETGDPEAARTKTAPSKSKIRCGRCAATLKIPPTIRVFRCPRCAAKLRAPASLEEGSGAPTEAAEAADARGGRSETKAAEAEEAEKKASAREKASGDRLAETRRAAREELERHVAFSKSLEDVVEALARRLAPSRARGKGIPDVDLSAAPLRAKI